MWVTKGHSKATLGAFFDALGPERAAELEIVTTDGAEWIRAMAAERAPNAEICLDTFHVIAWATKALDEVRRDLWRTLGRSPLAKTVKSLPWVLLRNWTNLSIAQRDTIRELETTNRKLFRAWLLKEELADISKLPLLKARRALDDWLYTNGTAEANNSVIGRIRRNANGFHNPKAFITMIMLDRGGLGPQLPWTP